MTHEDSKWEPPFVRPHVNRDRARLTQILHILRGTDAPIAPRPTIWRGIPFRSKLEIRFAMHLEEKGETWAYEPRHFDHVYLPDFEITSAKRRTYIEVKPTLKEVPAAQQKMSVIWRTFPDALLIVACEEGAWYSAALKGEEWESWQERWAA